MRVFSQAWQCLAETVCITPIRDEVKNRHRGLDMHVRPRHTVHWIDTGAWMWMSNPKKPPKEIINPKVLAGKT